MSEIYVNFVALLNQDFSFDVYRKVVGDQSDKKSEEDFRYLVGRHDHQRLFDFNFCERDGYEKCRMNSNDKIALTKRYITHTLKSILSKSSIPYRESNSKFSNEIYFPIESHAKGDVEISVSVYYLSETKQFGFLLSHSFRKNKDVAFDREVQRLSLSLDSSNRPNRNYYGDKWNLINNFLATTLVKICDCLDVLSIEHSLTKIESDELKKKVYLVGNNKPSRSQFVGLMNEGPYRKLDNKTYFIFIFTEEVRTLARDVYLGLTGKLFPGQFKGLESVFGVHISKENVGHVLVSDYEKESINKVIDEAKLVARKNQVDSLIIVAILPQGERERHSGIAYSYLKLLSVQNGFNTQVILKDTMWKKEQLKWSLSNIGLQIFSKLGGVPWLVQASNEDCLIFGLGSSHKKNEDGTIKKYLAYTICLDSSGQFNHVSPLAESTEEADYLIKLKDAMLRVIEKEVENGYRRCVVHVPFKIKFEEVEQVRTAVREVVKSKSIDIRIIKINTEHKFFGFSQHNTKVPYEGEFLRLGYGQYLMWPDGLEHGKEKVNGRIPDPLHIEFIHDDELKSSMNDRSCLQDIVNLTGANWRGFNSKSQPISILYSRTIAKFMKEFELILGEEEELKLLSEEDKTPWFL